MNQLQQERWIGGMALKIMSFWPLSVIGHLAMREHERRVMDVFDPGWQEGEPGIAMEYSGSECGGRYRPCNSGGPWCVETAGALADLLECEEWERQYEASCAAATLRP